MSAAEPTEELPLSPHQALFQVPDHEKTTEKRINAVQVGGYIGLSLGWFSNVLDKENTVVNLLRNKKTVIAMRTVAGCVIGALAGGCYIVAVQQTNKLRGNKNDIVNQYAGGYASVLPIAAAFRKGPVFFGMAGFAAGSLFTILKFSGQSDMVQDVYKYGTARKPANTNFRYPELYLLRETVNDIRNGKFKDEA